VREFAPVPSHPTERVRVTDAGGFRFVESRNYIAVPLHAHERATLTFVLDGALEESYAGRRRGERLAAASVLWRPPGLPHADRFAPEGAHTAVLELDGGRAELVAGMARGLEEAVHERGRGWEEVRRRLGRELLTVDSARTLALEGLALEALAELARQRTPVERDPAPPWLERVRELLHARYLAPELRVGELAAVADVHPVHLARVFRARLGCTPAAYVRRLRLEAAAQALATTARSIGEIALDCAFADQSHLTRAFRQAYGVPPAQFRARSQPRRRQGGPRIG
jgi:AraC family transcriptional regulator